MIDNLSIAIYTLTKHLLTSLSVDEMLLPMYVNLSTNLHSGMLSNNNKNP